MNEEIKALLGRIRVQGYYGYAFQPGEKQSLFEEHNRLVREGHIQAPLEYATGCGACVSKVYHRLSTYLNNPDPNTPPHA